MSASSKYQAPKGTRDFYPAEMALRRHLEGVWRRASVLHGFDEIEGPTFEHLELYTAKSGPGIVSELFSFRRSGGESDYALRPEFTPTLARMIAARAGALPVPVKWFAIPQHFRAERPQRGRLREFIQWNVDLVGLEGAGADVEVMAVALHALELLGLSPKEVRCRVSDRHAVAAVLAALGVAPERAAQAFELLDRRGKVPGSEFAAQAAAIGLDMESLARLDAIAGRAIPVPEAPAFFESVMRECSGVAPAALDPLRALAAALGASGVAEWCDFDLGIVRGLAYYTGTVFEIHDTHGAERAVAGGGRYDGLVELFGGPSMPAIGFGMGDVVLSLMLRDRGLLPSDGAALLPRPAAFLIAASPEGEERLPALATELRRAGLHVRRSYKSTRNVGKLLAEAAKQRARVAVILGAELAEGAVTVKNLDSGSQRTATLGELASVISAERSAAATNDEDEPA
ncbi:MAG: histidine--tRNA ligase [Phycisphaeraceae bacterium]|nr:histidine--tRNA ligase [Phycisphaeraceae bacterium]